MLARYRITVPAVPGDPMRDADLVIDNVVYFESRKQSFYYELYVGHPSAGEIAIPRDGQIRIELV